LAGRRTWATALHHPTAGNVGAHSPVRYLRRGRSLVRRLESTANVVRTAGPPPSATSTKAPGTPPPEDPGSPGHDGTQPPSIFVHSGGSPPCGSRVHALLEGAAGERGPARSSRITVKAAHTPTAYGRDLTWRDGTDSWSRARGIGPRSREGSLPVTATSLEFLLVRAAVRVTPSQERAGHASGRARTVPAPRPRDLGGDSRTADQTHRPGRRCQSTLSSSHLSPNRATWR
jgi:hypothetical protein